MGRLSRPGRAPGDGHWERGVGEGLGCRGGYVFQTKHCELNCNIYLVHTHPILHGHANKCHQNRSQPAPIENTVSNASLYLYAEHSPELASTAVHNIDRQGRLRGAEVAVKVRSEINPWGSAQCCREFPLPTSDTSLISDRTDARTQISSFGLAIGSADCITGNTAHSERTSRAFNLHKGAEQTDLFPYNLSIEDCDHLTSYNG